MKQIETKHVPTGYTQAPMCPLCGAAIDKDHWLKGDDGGRLGTCIALDKTLVLEIHSNEYHVARRTIHRDVDGDLWELTIVWETASGYSEYDDPPPEYRLAHFLPYSTGRGRQRLEWLENECKRAREKLAKLEIDFDALSQLLADAGRED